MLITDSLEKILMLGKIKDKRRRGWQRMKLDRWQHRLNGYGFECPPEDSEGQGKLECCTPWGYKELDMTM